MLGLQDPWVFAAYLSCILSTVLCVAWGLYYWNRDAADDEPESEVRHWAEEEDKVEEKL